MKPLIYACFALLMSCASASTPVSGFPDSPHHNANFEVLKKSLIRTGAGLMRANAGQCKKTRLITTLDEQFPICAVKVAIENSPIPNAHTNGNTILVTTAMIEALSIDELAFILSHELAHSVAGHDIDNGSRPHLELEADRLGVSLMRRAGYDAAAAASALRTLGIDRTPATASHPSGAARIATIESAVNAR